jgi:hypothetical protein
MYKLEEQLTFIIQKPILEDYIVNKFPPCAVWVSELNICTNTTTEWWNQQSSKCAWNNKYNVKVIPETRRAH